MRTFPGHGGFVEAVAFSPDGRTLASGGEDGTVRLWDVPGGASRGTLRPWKNGRIGALAYSPDGRLLAARDYAGRVRVFEGESARADWRAQGRLVGLAFEPAGRWLAWASYTGAVLCGFPGGDGHLRPFAEALPRPFCLAVSPDGRTVALGHQSDAVTLWDSETHARGSLLHGLQRGCWGLAFSPDGRRLALALGEGVQVWETARRRLSAELGGHDDVVAGVAWSPDGRRLLSCGWDGTVRVYDAAGQTPALLESYDWKIGRLFAVAFSPDGTLAAAGGDRGDHLLAWDVE